MNEHGHFGYTGNTEIVGYRPDGSVILSDDSDNDIWPGSCRCNYCSSEKELFEKENQDKIEHKANILQKTLNWFNAQFGTGLEELDCGEPGNPGSCVLAMTLKHHVNPNFQWNVSGSSIYIGREQKVNNKAYPDVCGEVVIGDPENDYSIRAIPVEVGGECSDIATRQVKATASPYTDYDIIDSSLNVVSPTDFPSYVQEFIHKFDDKEYQELLDEDYRY